MEDLNNILSEEAIRQGWRIREDQDHIVELLCNGELIARFSSSGVQIENILKEVELAEGSKN